MKQVVSISLGSSSRDTQLVLDLAGEKIAVVRRGTNGSIKRASELLKQYDGQVDAFGLGGADFGMWVDHRYFPLHSVNRLAGLVKQTPFTDGTSLKNCFERGIVSFLEKRIGEEQSPSRKRVLLVNAVSRWGMARSFIDAGYDCVYGDYMFSLGVPLGIRSTKAIIWSARLLLPILSRLPFSWIYPVGEAQEKHRPRFKSYFDEADIIAGDCLYITQSIPEGMDGKIVITNTTTKDDMMRFTSSGIRYVITTTPVFEGRSFGMNILEAILIALSGEGRKLSEKELLEMIQKLGLEPQIRKLEP